MTLEQKKQVTDALVSFVLRVTSSSHGIDREEVAILPAILNFLMKTDSPERLPCISSEDVIVGELPSINLYRIVEKTLKSKEQ